MSAGRGGRAVGTPNRDKAELRALLQERVHEFTEMRRAQDIAESLANDVPPAQAEALAQQIVDDYDPVVALAITAVDRRTPLDTRVKCNAEVARYVRPQLKSIEVQTDAATAEDMQLRGRLASKILDLVEDVERRARENSSSSTGPDF